MKLIPPLVPSQLRVVLVCLIFVYQVLIVDSNDNVQSVVGYIVKEDEGFLAPLPCYGRGNIEKWALFDYHLIPRVHREPATSCPELGM